MISYHFKRRAFLTALGGGLGLKIALRNLEASAQGMKSPARLLVTHWPIGIVAGSSEALWKPTSGSVGGSPALKAFADAGLAADMTVLRGISTTHLTKTGGGGSEQSMVQIVTGKMPPGMRANCCEGDDTFAAPGGSYDQILLRDVPALQRPAGYANSIADSRTDFGEVSARTMSYSTISRPVATYGGGTGEEAIPLAPVLSPLTQYNVLFGTFVPGGGGAGGASGGGGAGGAGTRPVAEAMMRRLVRKKSALDFAIEELNQLKALAPASARSKLAIHTDAVQSAEQSLVAAINTKYPSVSGPGAGGTGGGGNAGTGGAGPSVGPTCSVCATKPAAPPMTNGLTDPFPNGDGNHFGADTAKMDDAPIHQAAGKAHLDVLKAAFVCDVIRVGTFQWAPSVSHVGFPLHPTNTNPLMHHPASHRINTLETINGSTPEALQADARFLYNVQLWYFARHAEHMAAWKGTVDGCGNSLLDFTCVPFLTEVAATSHERTNIPGMIIGGKKLGFTHDVYKSGAVTINDVWATIGQAVGHPGGGDFGTPIAGLWTKPA